MKCSTSTAYVLVLKIIYKQIVKQAHLGRGAIDYSSENTAVHTLRVVAVISAGIMLYEVLRSIYNNAGRGHIRQLQTDYSCDTPTLAVLGLLILSYCKYSQQQSITLNKKCTRVKCTAVALGLPSVHSCVPASERCREFHIEQENCTRKEERMRGLAQHFQTVYAAKKV